MLTAKMSSTGRIKLPPKVRRVLDVKPGERVGFVVAGERVWLQSATGNMVQTLAGSLQRYAKARSRAEAERPVVREGVARAAAQEG